MIINLLWRKCFGTYSQIFKIELLLFLLRDQIFGKLLTRVLMSCLKFLLFLYIYIYSIFLTWIHTNTFELALLPLKLQVNTNGYSSRIKNFPTPKCLNPVYAVVEDIDQVSHIVDE